MPIATFDWSTERRLLAEVLTALSARGLFFDFNLSDLLAPIVLPRRPQSGSMRRLFRTLLICSLGLNASLDPLNFNLLMVGGVLTVQPLLQCSF